MSHHNDTDTDVFHDAVEYQSALQAVQARLRSVRPSYLKLRYASTYFDHELGPATVKDTQKVVTKYFDLVQDVDEAKTTDKPSRLNKFTLRLGQCNAELRAAAAVVLTKLEYHAASVTRELKETAEHQLEVMAQVNADYTPNASGTPSVLRYHAFVGQAQRLVGQAAAARTNRARMVANDQIIDLVIEIENTWMPLVPPEVLLKPSSKLAKLAITAGRQFRAFKGLTGTSLGAPKRTGTGAWEGDALARISPRRAAMYRT